MPHYYTYNVQILVKRTHLRNKAQRQKLHGILHMAILHCLGSDAY